MGCLDDLTITNLVGNALPEPQRVAALAHLDTCRACSELVGAMAVGSPRTDAEPRRLAPGTAVGRYVVEHVAGAGAMGVVYAARDPKLDRTVALKLVGIRNDERAQERMLREAKAMAQLSHRNVVSIFDVGTFGDDVFLAMEYLPGRTLRQWLAEPRRPREIVAVLADAGRGLAAAHAAGIIHRDVKPENVLIADDHRVCVTDFGLARATDAIVEAPAATETPVGTLTATGHILGTPVYMAPEQLAGGVADVRSDQFSFCVVAYECLAGRRPFEGRTLGELRESITQGAQPIPRVPAWIHRVILRGLAPDPDARFSAMTALLDALARDPAIRYRRLAVAGGLVAVAAGAVLVIPRGGGDACPDPRARLAGTWDASRRAELQRAFAARPHPFTAATVATVTSSLDRYTDQWVAIRLDACRATYERRDQSEARYDAELACLERRRGELGATIDVLTAAPDEQTVRSAVALVKGLSDLGPCRDGEELVEQTPLPPHPGTRIQLDAAFRNLASAGALAKTAKYHGAQRILDELLPRVHALGFAPLTAETLFLHGKLQMMTSRDATLAERELNEAATLAASAKDDALVARTWIQLVYTVGAIARRFPEAEQLGRVARTAIQRAGDPDELVIDWHNVLGAVLVEQANYVEALSHFSDALAIAERSTGAGRTRLADQLTKLASVLNNAGQFGEARKYAERAVSVTEAELGPDHPDLAGAVTALGSILYGAGEFADSQRQYRRALAILDKLGEPDTYNTSEAIEGIAISAFELGDYDEARKQHERVLAIRRDIGPDDPRVGDSLINLGMVLVAQGDVEAGRAHYDRALALYRAGYGPTHPQVAIALRQRAQLDIGTQQAVADLEEALRIMVAAAGPDHPEVGVVHGNLGAAYAGVKRWRDAQRHYQLAIDNHEKALGAKHTMVAMALTGLGQAQIAQGDLAGATKSIERALALHDENGAIPTRKAVARWMLARALWDRDRKRARELAAQVDAELGDAKDPTSRQVRAEMKQLLGGTN